MYTSTSKRLLQIALGIAIAMPMHAVSPGGGKAQKDPDANDPVVDGVEARCLQDGAYGKANEVALVPRGELAELEKNGVVDSTPAAVTYSKSLVKADS